MSKPYNIRKDGLDWKVPTQLYYDINKNIELCLQENDEGLTKAYEGKGKKLKNQPTVLYTIIKQLDIFFTYVFQLSSMFFLETQSEGETWQWRATTILLLFRGVLLLFRGHKKLAPQGHHRGSFPHDGSQAHFFLKDTVEFCHNVAHKRTPLTRRIHALHNQLHELFHAFSCKAITQPLVNDGRYAASFLKIVQLQT